jgi:hypothetical protein
VKAILPSAGRITIPSREKLLNGLLQSFDADKHSPADAFARQFANTAPPDFSSAGPRAALIIRPSVVIRSSLLWRYAGPSEPRGAILFNYPPDPLSS